MAGTPPAEVDVTVDLVRRLLRTQHPGLAERYESTATRTRSTFSRVPTAACAPSSTSGTSRPATRPPTWRPRG
jgi:molybdopterin biosynthesis enzyme MoaB